MNTAAMETNLEQTVEAAPLPEPAVAQTVNWDEVGEELDSVEGDVEVLKEPEVLKEVVTAAVEPVAEAPVQSEVPAKVYIAPPVAQAELPQLSQEELEKLYQLSEDEAAAMFTEPEKVLPKLLAKMHQQATKSVLDSMQTAVPQIVQRTESVARVETEARNAFFSVNEDLAKPEFEATVLKMGRMFREINPTASKEEAVVRIGELTRAALGLPGKGAPAAKQEAPAVVPFTPSRGGTGGAVPAPKNMWTELAAEFDSEDN